jgi:DNA-binding LacI/PurR family transcriptional regulator
MTRHVTVRDVARRAQVSHGTVSRVFNNHINANDHASTSVNIPGIGINAVRSLAFLLFQPSRSNLLTQFWAEILHGAHTEAHLHGIQIIYQSINIDEMNEEEIYDTVLSLRQHGYLLVGLPSPNIVSRLSKTHQLMVVIDNAFPELHVDSVISDNFSGARQIVSVLTESGHHDIAFIGGPLKPGTIQTNAIYTIDWRAKGFRQSLFDAGLNWQNPLCESGELTIEGGYEACKRLLARGMPFTGLFCANDMLALGACRALREAGKEIPQDVSVVGFDDDPTVSMLFIPHLTTVRVFKEAMGKQAIRTLLSRFRYLDSPATTTILDVALVLRDSVAPVIDR